MHLADRSAGGPSFTVRNSSRPEYRCIYVSMYLCEHVRWIALH